jgi:hypothetical protein
MYGISKTAFFTSYIINNRGSGVTLPADYIQITKDGLGRAH